MSGHGLQARLSSPTTPEGSLRPKVFTPKPIPASTAVPSDKGRSGPLVMAGLCSSLQQGQDLTSLSASAAGLVFAGILHAVVERVHLAVLAAIFIHKL